MNTEPDQYDTPWKEALELHFPEFMAFYFPHAHRQIDWSQGHTFLEQELQAVTRDAELGKRYADKLVQVHRASGEEDWIYIHLEVQGDEQAEFAKRMFVYNYRIFDKYERPVASMALLADDNPDWKPQHYSFEALGCRHTLQFPVAKLLDYTDCEELLHDNPNPFALVTLAHLQTRATRKDPQARYEAKWRLIKILFNQGWSKPSIIGLLRVIDWMMHLPDHFKQQLWENLQQLATEKHMTYVTSFEQICIDKGMQAGMQAGRQEGRQEGESALLKRLLNRRFGLSSIDTQARLDNATLEQLEQWAENILDAKTLEDVFKHH